MIQQWGGVLDGVRVVVVVNSNTTKRIRLCWITLTLLSTPTAHTRWTTQVTIGYCGEFVAESVCERERLGQIK